MARQTDTPAINMEFAEISGTSLEVSRVAIGTWAIGGWMWGGTDEAQSVATIRAALEHGINVIDTAPAYGFGRSEEIVGRAIAEAKLRSRVLIATKVGLAWEGGKVFRDASRGVSHGEAERFTNSPAGQDQQGHCHHHDQGQVGVLDVVSQGNHERGDRQRPQQGQGERIAGSHIRPYRHG